jgi:hypothetical protein
VLSAKNETVENKKRKDYATEKWEQEVREALAKKKSFNSRGKLSKADQAAVLAQLAKEADVRRQIATLQAKLSRGIELVAALVTSNAEAVGRHVGDLAKALLESAFGPGSFLVDNRAFNVFIVSCKSWTDARR